MNARLHEQLLSLSNHTIVVFEHHLHLLFCKSVQFLSSKAHFPADAFHKILRGLLVRLLPLQIHGTHSNFKLIFLIISTPRAIYRSTKVFNYSQRQIGSVSINLSRHRAFKPSMSKISDLAQCTDSSNVFLALWCP